MSAAASRVYEYVQDRRHAGHLADPSAVGRSSMGGQPPHTTLYLKVADDTVREGRFQTSGCGFLMACCAAAIDLSLERPVADCRRIEAVQLVQHLGGLPENRLYCAELAVAALHDALATVQPTAPPPVAE